MAWADGSAASEYNFCCHPEPSSTESADLDHVWVLRVVPLRLGLVLFCRGVNPFDYQTTSADGQQNCVADTMGSRALGTSAWLQESLQLLSWILRAASMVTLIASLSSALIIAPSDQVILSSGLRSTAAAQVHPNSQPASGNMVLWLPEAPSVFPPLVVIQ